MARRPAGYLALLRGINVGGKNRLPMKDLALLFEEAGCEEVRTYIQSGNVLFEAAPALARRVPALIAEAIHAQLGLRVPVVTRSVQELCKVARGNPFLKAGTDPSGLHVVFLADKPSQAKVAALDPNRSPGDALEVRGREIYLHCPKGVARSKLTNAYFDSKLCTISTARNWRTVLKLVALAEA